ncbi:two-pore calcium channel 2 [Elysia marginata]|uniref:Two-pore calcium channel 2 n=1 Tax=Elysia marginata TaxID=1093978 RepID=A0AAV4EM44_9GAST|nr:two-pore calcium channel 2 [Elysia marginata]
MLVITVLHLLAFVEYPSSLTLTSDPRYRGERIALPCWLTQSTELMCLLILLVDNIIRIYLMGLSYFTKNKWDMLSMIIITFSFCDWCVSFAMGCKEFIRFRRILRPYFLLQNSSLMKKIVRCLRRTMPEVISVLMLMFFHLYIFTLLGMLLFPEFVQEPKGNGTVPHTNDEDKEGSTYFKSLLDSFISLLVLLTTANNPDVTIPAYSRNRFAAIFFILYLVIGLYFFMNVLLAVIYNQFRGYFLSSLQSSLMRRRLGVRAAFEVLLSKVPRAGHSIPGLEAGMGSGLIMSIITRCNLPKYITTALTEELNQSQNEIFTAAQFQRLFQTMDKDIIHKEKAAVTWCAHPQLRRIQRAILHKYFCYFGMLVAAANLLMISIELGLKKDTSLYDTHSMLRIMNFAFVLYYMAEQLLKLWAKGWARYVTDPGDVFDAIVSLALVTGEIVVSALNESPFHQKDDPSLVNSEPVLWNIIRMINILIMVRMFKILPLIQSMNLVASVLLDLIKNMKAFLGISVVCFYAFAVLGIELFHGAITYDASMSNKTFECGSYEQLEYWANNFDDFYVSNIILP